MTVTFHCENCKKKINAPDGTGGKWGKCPNCNHRCYIPLPKSGDEDELKLAPLNPAEEAEYRKMMKETRELRRKALRKKDRHRKEREEKDK